MVQIGKVKKEKYILPSEITMCLFNKINGAL